jgi:hypothetical protein
MAIKRRNDISIAEVKKAPNVEYADNVNKRYDISTAAKVRAAITYLARKRNQSFYTKAELRIIAKRILQAAKRFKVAVSPDSYLYTLAGLK